MPEELLAEAFRNASRQRALIYISEEGGRVSVWPGSSPAMYAFDRPGLSAGAAKK
jgi:hypothetical protein